MKKTRLLALVLALVVLVVVIQVYKGGFTMGMNDAKKNKTNKL